MFLSSELELMFPIVFLWVVPCPVPVHAFGANARVPDAKLALFSDDDALRGWSCALMCCGFPDKNMRLWSRAKVGLSALVVTVASSKGGTVKVRGCSIVDRAPVFQSASKSHSMHKVALKRVATLTVTGLQLTL